MRHFGALRLDHVMALFRQWWVPVGLGSTEGGYVHYPLDDLMSVLALESERGRCLVVGEDLGTVPEGLRERLAAADVLSYRVLWFEREGSSFVAPAGYPAKAAVAVSTHDLPTIAGWWAGADIEEKASLGLVGTDAATAAKQERARDKRALSDAIAAAGISATAALSPGTPHDGTITAAIHQFAGGAASALLLLQADDLAGELTALNLPGTDLERPNWRRKVRVGVDGLWQTPTAVLAIAGLAARKNPP
jgi:4-alpha-glucanotransferase